MKRILALFIAIAMVLSTMLVVNAEETADSNVYSAAFSVNESGYAELDGGFTFEAIQNGTAVDAETAGLTIENGVLTVDASKTDVATEYRVYFPKAVDTEKAIVSFDLKFDYWYSKYSTEGWSSGSFCSINDYTKNGRSPILIYNGYLTADTNTDYYKDAAYMYYQDTKNTYSFKFDLDQTESKHNFDVSVNSKETTPVYKSNTTYETNIASYIRFSVPALWNSVFSISNIKMAYDTGNAANSKTVTFKNTNGEVIETKTVNCGESAALSTIPQGPEGECFANYYLDKELTKPTDLFMVLEDTEVYVKYEYYIIKEDFGDGFSINEDGTITTDSGFTFTMTQNGVPNAEGLSVENGVLSVKGSKVTADSKLTITFDPIKSGTVGTLAFTMAIPSWGTAKGKSYSFMGINGLYDASRGFMVQSTNNMFFGGSNTTSNVLTTKNSTEEHRYTLVMQPETNSLTASGLDLTTGTSFGPITATASYGYGDIHSLQFNISAAYDLDFTLDDIVLVRDNNYGTLAESLTATELSEIPSGKMYHSCNAGMNYGATNLNGLMWFNESGELVPVSGVVRLVTPEADGATHNGQSVTGNAYGFIEKLYLDGTASEHTMTLIAENESGETKTRIITFDNLEGLEGEALLNVVYRGVPSDYVITAE